VRINARVIALRQGVMKNQQAAPTDGTEYSNGENQGEVDESSDSGDKQGAACWFFMTPCRSAMTRALMRTETR